MNFKAEENSLVINREIDNLVLELGGFEGPIDLLLTLARKQKVDLAKISILLLAEQYLSFISSVKKIKIELAADYLVMAAWLAYLKSRLLLPQEEDTEEVSGSEMADALSFQLQRLDSMRKAAEMLLASPRLGHDVFGRGAPEGLEIVRSSIFKISLYQLLKSYGDNQKLRHKPQLTIEHSELFTISEAIKRMRRLIADTPNWTALTAFLPERTGRGIQKKSAIASTFAATLELVKEGNANLQQAKAFDPIFVKFNDEIS
tara:strand:+ start:385 stop:1164 length:780 start_codon:yes stop_codon:yes gene_type:complete